MQFKIHDDQWQTPAITEKFAYDRIKASGIVMPDITYFAFPWASYIDTHDFKVDKADTLDFALQKILDSGKPEGLTATVCQHIHFRKYLNIFKQAGITDLFCAHASRGESELEGIRIWPFPLYPLVHPEISDESSTLKSFQSRKLLFSFLGTHNPEVYMTKSRVWINELLNNIPETVVQLGNTWHLEHAVYGQQIFSFEQTEESKKKQLQRERSYRELMADTQFSLCPSGSGPNSIRFWESLEFGCIPVLMADTLALPGEMNEWNFAIVRVPEARQEIAKIPQKLKKILQDEENLRERLARLKILRDKYSINNSPIYIKSCLQGI